MMVQAILGRNVSMVHKKLRSKVMVEMDNVKLFMLLTGLLIDVTRYEPVA